MWIREWRAFSSIWSLTWRSSASLGFFPAGLQPQAVAVEHILKGIPVLPGLGQLLLGRVPALLKLAHPLLTGGQLLMHRLIPVQQLLGRGG